MAAAPGVPGIPGGHDPQQVGAVPYGDVAGDPVQGAAPGVGGLDDVDGFHPPVDGPVDVVDGRRGEQRGQRGEPEVPGDAGRVAEADRAPGGACAAPPAAASPPASPGSGGAPAAGPPGDADPGPAAGASSAVPGRPPVSAGAAPAPAAGMITGPRSVSTTSTVTGAAPLTSTVSVWARAGRQPSGPRASTPPSAVRRSCSRYRSW